MLPSVSPKGNPPSGLLARCANFCRRLPHTLHPHPAAPPPVPGHRPGARLRPRPSLAQLARPDATLPAFVTDCPVARRYLALLGPLDWDHFPERPTHRPWPGQPPAPRAPFAAAYLVKLNEGHKSMGQLRRYLLEHPALVWLLGFPLRPDPQAKHGFDLERSLPSRRQLSRVLRELDNAAAQFLLDSAVHLLHQALPPELQAGFGDVIALDTKHVIAWVKENNPKAYVEDRYDKTRQPKGDPDCKLGCKKRHNIGEGNGDAPAAAESGPTAPPPAAAPARPPATPTTYPQPADKKVSTGEYYWGYASGVVTTKVPGWGEFVLAELTQTFDHGDLTYFFPLMAMTVRRLGRQPRFGALDAGFDAFYVYQYFHDAGGFAAVPWVPKGHAEPRTFSPEGLPLCAAGLPMSHKFTYIDRTKTLVVHQRARYVCPQLGASACPIQHEKWSTGGCTADLPTCAGARLRDQLDRHSAAYQAIYHQRTADERTNSLAVDLGIERPHLRRGSAIVNQNTLIYVLTNLRALQRIQAHQAALAAQPGGPKEVTATPHT